MIRWRKLVAFAAVLISWRVGAQEGTSPSAEKKISPRKETVVVTGTLAPAPETEVDRAVTVIDGTQQNLSYKFWSDLLNDAPSVDLRQRGQNDIQADLSIRGSSFGETLVLLNGLRMDDAQSGHHDMDLPLPTSSIGRIEVLRGAGSALYGSDAMAGTVNVITSRPEYSDVRVGAGVGNFGVNQEYGSAAIVHGPMDFVIDAERDFSSGFRRDRDYRSATFFSDLGIQSAAGRSNFMFGYADKPFGADQFYGPFNSWERTKSWFAGWTQNLGKNTDFDFGFRRHSDEFVLFRDNPSVYENNHVDRSWQADIRRHHQVSANSTLFYGAAGIHEDLVSTNFSGGVVSDALGTHNRSRGAVYVDYDVRAWKRFSFSAAAREEIFSSSHGEFDPTLAAGFWISSRVKLKGSASRAFRLPSYTDWDYHDPANFGNPNLGPESAWDYEGGILWLPNSKWKAEATLFERRDHNVIDYVLRTCSAIPASELPPGASCSAAIPQVYHAENLQNLNFTGVEGSVQARLPWEQTVQVSYTALHGVQNVLTGLQTRYTFEYPRNDGIIAWHGTLPGKIIARSRIGVLDRFASDPYALWDAAVAREFSHFGMHLVVSNITDTQYQEIPGVVMPGRSVVFGLDFFWRAR